MTRRSRREAVARTPDRGSWPDLGDPAPPLPWSAAAIGLGGTIGVVIAATAGGPYDAAWYLWASLAGGLTAAAGLTALVGWRAWRVVSKLRPAAERRRRPLLVTLLAAGVLVGANVLVGGARSSSFRGEALVSVAILGAIPTAATMMSSIHVARSTPAAGGRSRVELLAGLRMLQRRLLVGLGALVALATLALGASLQRLPAGVGDQRGVLVLGAIGSAWVAAVYVPAASTVRDQVRREAQSLFPVDGQGAGGVVLQRLKERRELEQLVLGDQRIYDELVTSLVVLGPLLAGGIQSLVTG